METQSKTVSKDGGKLKLPGTVKHLPSGYTGIKGPPAITAMMLLGRRRFWTALVSPGAAGDSICFSTQFITPVARMVNEQWPRDQKQEERSSNDFIIGRLS